MDERTLVLVKPDGVVRGLVGEVISRIERRGYRFVAADLRHIDVETAEEHYAEHKDKPFFRDLVEFITSGPLFAALIEGPGVVAAWRSMMGSTDPIDAAPGTIRGDLGTCKETNIVHGSDSLDSAARETALFFPGSAQRP